ncbi:MAG: hypothetical protein O2960_22105, partial [Verrucomicrobia bacterium]|nr:hypothetical protein [Verrucomicrobiota bacterium]
MSDFLTSLAVRAVLPVPIIRPVVGSFYEPHIAIESPLPVPVTAAAPVESIPVASRNPSRSQPPAPAPGNSPHVSECRTPPHPSTRLDAASGLTPDPPPLIHSIPAPIPSPHEPTGRISERPQTAAASAEMAPLPLSPPGIVPVSVPSAVRPAAPPAASPLPRLGDEAISIMTSFAQEVP